MPSAQLGPWKRRCGGKYLVLRRDGTVPPWSWIVLGALDPAAPAALRAYAAECEVLGMDPEYVVDARRLAVAWEAERKRHEADGGKPGDPDAGPHRVDDPLIVTLLRNYSPREVVRAVIARIDRWVKT